MWHNNYKGLIIAQAASCQVSLAAQLNGDSPKVQEAVAR